MNDDVIAKTKVAEDLDEHLAFLRGVDLRGGPDSSEYFVLSNRLRKLWNLAGSNPDLGVFEKVREAISQSMGNHTLQGWCFNKPEGYAGDFKIIEKIYACQISSEPQGVKWDFFYQANEAVQAVRNRKSYFIKLCGSKLEKAAAKLRILNLASGPCRDVKELLEKYPEADIFVDCVDNDENAIEYAKTVLVGCEDKVSFTKANIVKYTPPTSDTYGGYDLIWSAGLFDYFKDQYFTALLSRFANHVKLGGELVLGNFSLDNPSRPYMETCGGWFLYHRSPDELVKLAVSAGVHPESIFIDSEPLGINLFMRIKFSG